ncbi:MAG: TetR/AcrR family transcriptional regulator [Myxococcales bacterium]|nr:TetR/AcrR family transcriptional regulator [Myxococcales bacterium]
MGASAATLRGRASPGKDADRKAQLRAAAVELFAEYGYTGMSMQMLMDACGVNKALVYYYFGSKEKLFQEILEDYFDRLAPAFDLLWKSEDDFRDRLAGMLGRYIDFLAANPEFPKIVQREVATRGPGLDISQRRLRPLFAAGLELLRREMPEFDAAPDALSPVDVILTVYSAVIGYFTYAPLIGELTGEDYFGAEAITRRKRHVVALADALIDAVRAHAAAAEK